MPEIPPFDELAGDGIVTLRAFREDDARAFLAQVESARRAGTELNHSIRKLGLARLEIVVHPDNAASQRVAERAGYTREAVLRSRIEMRDGRHDAVMFARVRIGLRPTG